MKKIAIIGGGVAGTTAALTLAAHECQITLFEKKSSLVGGPPFCHLHAGGNLYPDISIDQCIRLLEESFWFYRYFPFAVEQRPTLIVVPKKCELDPRYLVQRVQVLQKRYKKLCEEYGFAPFGDPKEYYTLFFEEDLKKACKIGQKDFPKTPHEWLAPVSAELKKENIKFPLILVQEYGLNIFRFSAGVDTVLNSFKNVTVKNGCEVLSLKKSGDGFEIEYKNEKSLDKDRYDIVINAAGFESEKIDRALHLKKERYLEFKAAYITRWDNDAVWPEIIFHGKRGTKNGMAQFTPYAFGFVQMHGMSKEITLFEGGLAKSDSQNRSPLNRSFYEKIDLGWDERELAQRTAKAIEHFKDFLESFPKKAKGYFKPLYGIQQIPGKNPDLRAAEVDIVSKNYFRCEIVKVSSAINMAKEIQKEIFKEVKENFDYLKILEEESLKQKAAEIARQRGYPSELSTLLNPPKLFPQTELPEHFIE